MKAIALALGISLLAAPSFAAGIKWVSADVFVGQTQTPTGAVLTYYPSIIAITPDAAGYYEVWTEVKVYTQESFADHEAIQERAACNMTGDNSCVNGQQYWVETLNPNPIIPSANAQ